jgi:molecular chaperone GrpE
VAAGEDTTQAGRPAEAEPLDGSVAAGPAEVAEDVGTQEAEPADGPRLEEVARQRDEYLDALQRMKADFENFRKRTERDRVQQRVSAAREVVMAVVPVLDNLERAVSFLGAQDESLVGGVEMVRHQLAQVLEGQGLTEVPALGTEFDPTLHEAVSVQPSPQPEGTVVGVVEKGYRLGDSVVRAAKVIVAAPAEG